MNAEEKLVWIDKLVESKSFEELSHEEKEFILEELGSEEQYAALRKVSLTLVYSSTPDLSPDPEVLSSLKLKLKTNAQHNAVPLWTRITQVSMPAYAAVLAIFVCSAIAWTLAAKPAPVIEATASPTIITDTVFVASNPDTVIVERVVYRTLMQAPAADKKIYSLVKNAAETREETPTGVSMEEKKELDKLLVSGSR